MPSATSYGVVAPGACSHTNSEPGRLPITIFGLWRLDGTWEPLSTAWLRNRYEGKCQISLYDPLQADARHVCHAQLQSLSTIRCPLHEVKCQVGKVEWRADLITSSGFRTVAKTGSIIWCLRTQTITLPSPSVLKV